MIEGRIMSLTPSTRVQSLPVYHSDTRREGTERVWSVGKGRVG